MNSNQTSQKKKDGKITPAQPIKYMQVNPAISDSKRMSMADMIEEFDEKRKPELQIQYTRLNNLGSFDDVVIALDKETLNATDDYELRIDENEDPILYLDDHLSSMFSYLDVNGETYNGLIGSKQLRMLEKVFPEESGFSRGMFPKQQDISFPVFYDVMKEWTITTEAKAWAKKKYKTENVEEVPEIAMWSGLGEEFEFNPAALLFFLFLHAATASVYAFYWQGSAKYTFIFFIACILYSSFYTKDFIKKLLHSEKRLRGLSSIFIPTLIFSFLLLLINFLIGSLVFNIHPMDTTTAEQVFPWFVCIFVTLGFGFITIYSNAETSRLARKRDAYLLQCIPTVTSPKDVPGEMLPEKLTSAAQVLVILYRNVGRDQKVTDEKYYNIRKNPRKVITRIGFFAIGSLIAVIYNIFCYYNPTIFNSSTSWERNFKPAWHNIHGTDSDNNGFIWYITMTLFGSASTLCSTLCLDYGINLFTTRPFRESKRLVEYLQATTDSAEARHFFVPYLPLYERVNIKAFLNIWTFLFKHQHKGTLNQGAAGLAGIMVLDFALVTALAVQYFFPMIAPSPCVMIIELFYACVLSYNAVYQLYFAIKINKIFEDLGHRISEWQAKALYNYHDAESIDQNEIYELLKNTKKIMEGAFEDIKILGIPATTSLAQAFGGYILSAVVFVLVSIVNNYGKA